MLTIKGSMEETLEDSNPLSNYGFRVNHIEVILVEYMKVVLYVLFKTCY